MTSVPQHDRSPVARPETPPPTSRAPYLSVIVPVWNGADQLPRTLHALHRMLDAQPYATELIVVDDCSGPAAERALRAVNRDIPVSVLRNLSNRGKGFSVARGMLAAQGDVRVFADANLAYPPEEIEAVVDAIERGSDVAIACRALPESR